MVNFLKFLFNVHWYTFNMDEGGGGQPTSQTVTQTSIPEYAKPYVEKMLGKAQALSDQPYKPYQGQRIAGFDPMQLQAQQNVANLGPSQQLGQATQMAGLAGLRAGNVQYDTSNIAEQRAKNAFLQQYQMQGPEAVYTGSFTEPGEASRYMSPYVQQALQPQLREARRQSDIAAQQQQAQAVGAGAYGGSRQAIVEAERQRNLQQQLGDITGRGYQTAFEQAQNLYGTEQGRAMQAALANQQMGFQTGQQNLQALMGVQNLAAQQGLTAQQLNQQANLEAQKAQEQSRQYGAGLSMQGLQTQLQAAGQLGQLGQTQFGQEKDIINALNAAGSQRQGLEQQGLDTDYQEFLKQQQYPYSQLGFMSDMFRGLPLSQGVQTGYQAPPSMLSQAAGLGFLGKGMGYFAEGGEVSNRPAGLAELALMRMSGD
jgi:hypothetical protein